MHLQGVGAPTTHEPAPTAGSWQIGSVPEGWWARERAAFLRERLRSMAATADRKLDNGCGRGAFAAELARLGPGFTVACDFEAYQEWRNVESRVAHVVADANRLPFRDGAFDLSVALDVIEHLPDDHPPLVELRRVTAADGHVGLTVPAFPSLWSPFDESVGHHRRYREADLARACAQVGLRPISSTYFFAWLAPAAWLLRRKNRRDADHDRPGGAGRVLDMVVSSLGRVERAWLRRRASPIGTSLWMVSRRPGAPSE